MMLYIYADSLYIYADSINCSVRGYVVAVLLSLAFMYLGLYFVTQDINAPRPVRLPKSLGWIIDSANCMRGMVVEAPRKYRVYGLPIELN